MRRIVVWMVIGTVAAVAALGAWPASAAGGIVVATGTPVHVGNDGGSRGCISYTGVYEVTVNLLDGTATIQGVDPLCPFTFDRFGPGQCTGFDPGDITCVRIVPPDQGNTTTTMTLTAGGWLTYEYTDHDASPSELYHDELEGQLTRI